MDSIWLPRPIWSPVLILPTPAQYVDVQYGFEIVAAGRGTVFYDNDRANFISRNLWGVIFIAIICGHKQ